uniref:Uncharacterized protein TCIL3000_10_11900 n=1 Tax=Trypanosoma congolense (strain IL3000) TaxID=1068625 RepID=G0UYE2_TRYCI|nr:unnamed protein product [Trypanosoma congolense IL3000]
MRCRRTQVLCSVLFASPAAQRATCHDQKEPRETHCNAVACDTTAEWVRSHVSKAVEEGRQSEASAAYFASIMEDQPEFRLYVKEAERLIGNQDPRSFTRYQKMYYGERLSRFMSGVASERLMRAHAENEGVRRHTQDGSSTGENYWFEAGQTLASPSVPNFIKNEVLREMREERKANSPAFEEPPAMADMAAKEEGFADHLRQQRQKLISPEDYLS